VASKQTICTCAHVISSVGAKPGEFVRVRLFDGALVEAHIEPQYWRQENAEDIAEWAGHIKLRQKRLAALEQLSSQRLESLRRKSERIQLTPAEPALKLA